MANRYRGDVDFELAGESITLRLTLGALAEIEAGFGVTGLNALGQRLAQGAPSATDFIRLLGAATRGGGLAISDNDLAARLTAADLPRCIAAVSELLTLTFGGPR